MKALPIILFVILLSINVQAWRSVPDVALGAIILTGGPMILCIAWLGALGGFEPGLLVNLRHPACCDECGALFPPTEGRITLCCSDPKGLYRAADGTRHNGKITTRRWRSPITFRNPLGW